MEIILPGNEMRSTYCHQNMEPKKEGTKRKKEPEVSPVIYDQETPLWNKYYAQVRRTIRFPRYYKKSLNW